MAFTALEAWRSGAASSRSTSTASANHSVTPAPSCVRTTSRPRIGDRRSLDDEELREREGRLARARVESFHDARRQLERVVQLTADWPGYAFQ